MSAKRSNGPKSAKKVSSGGDSVILGLRMVWNVCIYYVWCC